MLNGARKNALSLADAAAGAAASFLAGVIALHELSPAELAAYAIQFSAAVVVMIVPQTIAYLPQRLHVNKLLEPQRTNYCADMRLGIPLGFVSGAVVVIAGLPLAPAAGILPYTALALSAAAWTLVSPLQDHVRLSLHMTGHHASAAAVSITNLLLVILGLITIAIVPQGSSPWLPFTVLALSNGLSAILGMTLHRRQAPVAMSRQKMSVWLALKTSASSLITQSSSYFNSLIIAGMLSATALAELEGARIAAQPVTVLGVGMAATVLPQAVRARASGKTKLAQKLYARFAGGVLLGGVLYSAAMQSVLPILSSVASRSIDPLLAIARALSFAVGAAAGPLNSLNLADARYAKSVINAAVSLAIGIAATVALVPFIGVFAVPASATISAATRGLLGVRDLRRPSH